MSYCRTGEDSDIYVYRKRPNLLVCHSETGSFEASTEQEMIEHLLLHRRRGQRVPERALDRLKAERDGIPYETDVERALREMKEESWPNV